MKHQNMKSIEPKTSIIFFLQYLSILLFTIIFIFLFFLGLIIEMSESGDTNVIVPILLCILAGTLVWVAISFIMAHLVCKSYKWALTDLGFKKEYGVIRKRYVTIPYEKIQNVDIDRSLLHRIIGLSAISIQTAGYSSGAQGGRRQTAEGYLPGLKPEDAEKLQEDLLKHQKTKS